MACFREKLHVGEAFVAMVAAGALTTATAETVVVAAGALGAMLAAGGVYVENMYDLGTCLGNAGRADDAAKVRAQAESMQRDLDALRQKFGL